MKKLIEYLPFHFLICIISGITIQFYTNLWARNLILIVCLMLLMLCLLYIFKRNGNRKTFTVVSMILFILIGISTTFINNPKNYANHYQYNSSKKKGTTLHINKILKSSRYYHKFVAQVVQINSRKTIGNILVNLKKDSTSTLLKVGNQIYITKKFKNLTSPLNPYQFNYKDYLAKQYIYQQIVINQEDYKKFKKGIISIYSLSSKLRNRILSSLKKYSFTKDQLSVINALLLGQRQDISKNILNSYVKAGAIHILAISGLHIGIILLILSYLLTPIEKLKHGSYIKTALIIILLWAFAFVAGLSASVVRAVTMFCFIAVGESFKKKKVVEYSLISSMFFLLLIKPLFLFDVGFQLSYLAVFGIIWIQPLLYKLWSPKLWLFNKLWKLITISLAAQAGILPISLYYFHQFPGLFILSNLLIIPFLGGILIGGILIIILALSKALPNLLANIYGSIISLMNKYVNWISNQESFLFHEISMSFYEMITWYFIIISVYQLSIHKKTKQLLFLLFSIVLLQTSLLYNKIDREYKQEIIVFHKTKENLLGYRNGKLFKLLQYGDTLKTYNNNVIKAYRINENIKSNFPPKIGNIIRYNSDTILIIDSLGIYDLALKKPIIILQHSPKINLNRLIETLEPKQIIADGSNYKSSLNRWKATCKKQKTPFHQTRQNGAFIIK
ncbi:competence protein [Tenacibaculum sp. Bg11-29]|uniref:ComEC/Rec2 family competence protein n=1 Tax=Tenacibaculum sp. Bg11-29 TaxID=2058306 RepID=UPI000C3276CF|nr:ComEC/Rec2 family competence protein [Tenacibaculum sp. Bg11-29]PKH49255.1 competence protein [Tenacibaculum sp. Bg11-29]